MNAAIYCREATDEPVKGSKLPTQFKACRELAVQQGYNVVAEFAEVWPGTTLDRPELAKLRQLVKSRAVQVVIVYDASRLSRNLAHLLQLQEEFGAVGVSIQYVVGPRRTAKHANLNEGYSAGMAVDTARKRATIYARVSTDDQVKGYSISTQIEECHHYAAQRGYLVVEEFAEDFTGASLDRPKLNMLREFLAREHAEVVIVYDIDRLARKSIYQMIIEEEFNRQGVVVEYVIGQYDNTDEGRLQKQIRASIAEYEKAKIIERSKRGKRGKAKSGFVIVGARPPYGYRVKSEDRKAWLEIDEEEARVVRLVFDWYVRGLEDGQRLSIRGIAKRLTKLRIPTRGDHAPNVAKKHGTGVWQAAMISHILKNEAYIGTWYFGKTHIVSDGKEATRKPRKKCGFGKQVARPREDWIPVSVPPIIDEETWQAAQKRLEQNLLDLAGRPPQHEYLLTRRLRCAQCGYVMRGVYWHGRLYYVCVGTRQPVPACNAKSMRGDRLEEAIWQWVKDLLQNPERMMAGLRSSQEEAVQASKALHERLDVIDAQIAETDRQLERLLDLYLRGEFPKELLTERKMRLETTLNDLRRERGEIASHLSTTFLSDEQVAEIEAFCADVREGLDEATFEDKRRYFELLNLSGTLAVENGEKVVYLKCLIASQRLSDLQTLHL